MTKEVGREDIFISHSNLDDDQFTVSLRLGLTAAGYDVCPEMLELPDFKVVQCLPNRKPPRERFSLHSNETKTLLGKLTPSSERQTGAIPRLPNVHRT